MNITDVDGNTYSTVNINGTEWFTEPLRVARFRNGNFLQNITRAEYQYTSPHYGAAASADFNPNAAQYFLMYEGANLLWSGVYNRYYNANAMMDSRGLAPEGARIATYNDWLKLMQFLGNLNTSNSIRSLDGDSKWGDASNILDRFNMKIYKSKYTYLTPAGDYGTQQLVDEAAFIIPEIYNSDPSKVWAFRIYGETASLIPFGYSSHTQVWCIANTNNNDPLFYGI